MPVLLGGDTLKLTKGSGFSQLLRRPNGTVISPNAFSTLDQFIDQSDEKLFLLSRYNTKHVLHPLLPQPTNSCHNLRQQTHNLVLPSNVNAVVKQNFIYRMLFRDIY